MNAGELTSLYQRRECQQASKAKGFLRDLREIKLSKVAGNKVWPESGELKISPPPEKNKVPSWLCFQNIYSWGAPRISQSGCHANAEDETRIEATGLELWGTGPLCLLEGISRAIAGLEKAEGLEMLGFQEMQAEEKR